MGKNVLILSASPRKGGNSDTLCDLFAKGAAENGNTVEKVRVAEKKLGFCHGCYACEKTGKCFQADDAPSVIEKMLKADVIVLATPVYFYTMNAQLKALIDRSVSVYPKIAGKQFYFIMTMADTNEAMFKGTIEALRGFVACCENSTEAGIIQAAGVFGKDDIQGNAACNKAYEAGKSI